jgi:hypothetical protein
MIKVTKKSGNLLEPFWSELFLTELKVEINAPSLILKFFFQQFLPYGLLVLLYLLLVYGLQKFKAFIENYSLDMLSCEKVWMFWQTKRERPMVYLGPPLIE